MPPWRRVHQDPAIADDTPNELTVSHRAVVTEEQIDHLGHMNVRYYGMHARTGTDAVAASLIGETGIALRPVEVYARHHREQLLGASLVVRSGVLDADPRRLRIYHEIVNDETDTIAAAFVHRVVVEDAAGAPADLPMSVVERARSLVVRVPAHGRPRSIDLRAGLVDSAPPLALLRERRLAMRKPRAITPMECGPDGTFDWIQAPLLVWGGEPLDGEAFEPLMDGPNGERIGFATMETRLEMRRMPRVGDRVQAFTAVIDVRDKTSQRLMWAYDLEREDLLMAFEIVNLALDVNRRAPTSLPERMRAAELRACHPDLAPGAGHTA